MVKFIALLTKNKKLQYASNLKRLQYASKISVCIKITWKNNYVDLKVTLPGILCTVIAIIINNILFQLFFLNLLSSVDSFLLSCSSSFSNLSFSSRVKLLCLCLAAAETTCFSFDVFVLCELLLFFSIFFIDSITSSDSP